MRKKRSGLGEAFSSMDAVKRYAKKCDNPFFGAGERRFFNTRTVKVIPSTRNNMTLVVERVGGGDTPVRPYYQIVRVKDCKFGKIGKHGKGYKTSAAAIRVAKAIAGYKPFVAGQTRRRKPRRTRTVKVY